MPGGASERLKRAPRWILRAYSARDDVVSFRIRSQNAPGRSFDTSAGTCGNGLPREFGLIYAFKPFGPKNSGRGVVCQTYSENATKQPQIRGGGGARALRARAAFRTFRAGAGLEHAQRRPGLYLPAAHWDSSHAEQPGPKLRIIPSIGPGYPAWPRGAPGGPRPAPHAVRSMPCGHGYALRA